MLAKFILKNEMLNKKGSMIDHITDSKFSENLGLSYCNAFHVKLDKTKKNKEIKMKFRKLTAFAMFVVMLCTVIFSAAGCSATKTPVDNTDKSTVSPTEVPVENIDKATPAPTEVSNEVIMDKVQELNLFMQSTSLSTFDVNDAKTVDDFQILTQVQEGLARLLVDEDGREYYAPAGAESWDISADNLVWTFHLRDLVWSDGVAVTAQQYVDSILRLLDPVKAFTYGFYAFDIKNAEKYYNGECPVEDVAVRAIDDKTLEITLGAVSPQFSKKIGFSAMFPVRLDVIEKGGDDWANNFEKQVFNGPFVITEYITENTLVLEKNPTYWDAENVHLQKVTFNMVQEFSTKALLFESQQADMIEGYQDYTQKWIDRANLGEFKYIETAYPMLWWIDFNQRTGGLSGLMQNAKIRLAMSLGIDRDEFVDLIYGRHKAAYSLIPFGMSIGDSEFRALNPEPLKATYEQYKGDDVALQNLFKEGLKELGVDKELKDVTIVFISSGTDTIEKTALEYFQQSWQNKLGIKIDLQVFGDRKLFSAARNSDQYDIDNGAAWHADYDDPMTFMDLWLSYGSWGYYFGSYNSPTYDETFAKLAGEGDVAKRNEIYAQLEKTLVLDDAGMMPVYFEDSRNFVQNYVKNLMMPAYGAKYEFSRAYISGK